MPGVESVIGAAVLSVIIKNIFNTAISYFSNNYELHRDTQEMLDNLKNSLPRILLVLEFAERKPVVIDESLAAWLQQLKDVAYEAEDVMDDFEAKKIRNNLKNQGKVSEIANSSSRAFKSLFLSDSNEHKLKKLLNKMETNFNGISDLTKFIESKASDGSIGSSTRETSSFLRKDKKIFGRDKEIESILGTIIEERQDQSEIEGNDAPQGSITNRNLLKNILNFVSNCLKRIKEYISKMIKRVESSDSFGVTEENVNPIGHKFSSKETELSIGDPRIRILPIVGIGGIGKTTIARVIYNHLKVTEYFDIQGWVYVTDDPQPKNFLYEILCSFDAGTSKSNEPITSLSDGHDRIKRAIHNKRFLLVFDDVREDIDWISSTWKELREVLADGLLGSTIIVTTNSNSAANSIGTLPPVFLDYLPPEQFLGLFEYYAFDHSMKRCYCKPNCKNENHSFHLSQHQETVLKQIGKKIAEKLHGLPLAAEVIGTLLSGKRTQKSWEEILESDWWNLDVSKQIISPLGISFQNLDPDLKQCFMYCSLFPRNYVFHKDKLVQMWIANDLIHPTKAEQLRIDREEIRIEDIGRSKFDKLVDRLFFHNDIVKDKYLMHDIIRELAIFMSYSEMLYVSGHHLKGTKTIPSCVRHLAIDLKIDDDVYVDQIMKWSEKNIKLRTIMFFGSYKMSKDKSFRCILDNLVGLRLLNLSYISSEILLPDKCNLSSHLRFLDLSFSGIRIFPKSLFHLVHLQVLDIRGCKFSRLPNCMNRLINLRYLYVSPETDLFPEIGRLTNLQELQIFRVKKEEEEKGFTISELIDLNSLNGQLTLADLEKIPSKEKAHSAKIEKKRYLTSLKFVMTKTKHRGILQGAESDMPLIMLDSNNVNMVYKYVCMAFNYVIMTCNYIMRKREHHQILEGLKGDHHHQEILKEFDPHHHCQEIFEEFNPDHHRQEILEEFNQDHHHHEIFEEFNPDHHRKEIFEELKPEHHQKILGGLKPHKNIRELGIENFWSVSFPSWVMEIHEMKNLTIIELVQCLHVETLPPFGSLPSLEVLNLLELWSITCIGKEFYGTSDVIFPTLRELMFQQMRNWKIWSDPGERKHFPRLQKLTIETCGELSEAPLHCFKSMVELHLIESEMVTKNVGTYLAAMTSLTQLELHQTNGLKLNGCWDHLCELRVLTLGNIDVAQLQGQISSLVNLKKLSFSSYWRESSDKQHKRGVLQNILGPLQRKNTHSLPSLASIEVHNSDKIPEVLFRLGRFPSLRTLCIDGYSGDEFTSFEDSWLQRLSSLEELELSDCYMLIHLPPSLSTLSSLKKLSMDCPKIRSLPEQGLPRSLMELHIVNCSAELMQGCQPNTGAEWSKISHVPCIRVKEWYSSR